MKTLDEEVYTTNDVANILKCSYSHANQLMHSNKFKTIDIGLGQKNSKLCVTESEFKRFLGMDEVENG